MKTTILRRMIDSLPQHLFRANPEHSSLNRSFFKKYIVLFFNINIKEMHVRIKHWRRVW